MLSLLGWLYGRIANIRNTLYDRGFFASYSLGAKTISIGNITAGGTGKTPLVALVAEILAERGEKVCILTRGYGRENPRSRVLISDGENVLADARTGGDEPIELAHKLVGKAIIIADANRVAAAKSALERFGVTAFVLDDGFQHRGARRDLDIVCVDATDPWGNGKIIPAGKLREPLDNLERADAIVITRSNLVESTDVIVSALLSYKKTFEIFRASNAVYEISKLLDFLGGASTSEDDEDRKYIAGAYLFCALGNPQYLVAQLSGEHFDIGGFRSFPDHHYYTQNDIRLIESEAERKGARALLTTAKDAVKLVGINFEMPCFVVLSDSKINDEKKFKTFITAFS